jgi:hypothetical protein
MSDEGELGGHWSTPAENTSDDATTDWAAASAAQVGAPDQPSPAGAGTPEFEPPARPVAGQAPPPRATEPAGAEPAPWERSLFDGEQGAGDPRYAPVTPSGPATPPKPGTPSSGNLRLPDWMREEMSGGPNAGHGPADPVLDGDAEGRSRLMLYGGVSLLLAALLAAAAVYFLKSSDGGSADADEPAPGVGGATTPAAAAPPEVRLPANKQLMTFRGRHSGAVGVVPDRRAGVVYPRLGAPWQIPGPKSGLGKLGWSGQQVVVTESRNGKPKWYGQLLSGTLSAAQRNMYGGPGTEKAAAVALAKEYEARFYAFPHKTRSLASQRLTVDGRRGWLVGSYIGYRRPGVKATAEVVTVAVIDTGRPSPAVIFMAVPNTDRDLWPDINYVFSSLKLTP